MRSWTRSKTKRGRWMGLALLGVVAACGDDGGSTTAPTSPAESLRASIPQHGADPAAQARSTYAGSVEGSDALIAVVANGSAGVAYVCDGAEISEWFLGEQSGGTLELAGEKGGSLSGQLAGDSLDGSVSIADGVYAFATDAAVERESGIYRDVDVDGGERLVTAWIFAGGEWRGAGEDSGRNVVGTVSASGVGTATGSGTGLVGTGQAPPVPFFDCDQAWCNHEIARCFIIGINEDLALLKGKPRTQALRMKQNAQDWLSDIGDSLSENGCGFDSSHCDTGYQHPNDTPCCDLSCM